MGLLLTSQRMTEGQKFVCSSKRREQASNMLKRLIMANQIFDSIYSVSLYI